MRCKLDIFKILVIFGNSLGIWKELICLSRFWFLSRFCLNKEGRKDDKKFRSLEVREASSSHLKMKNLRKVLTAEYDSKIFLKNQLFGWFSSGFGKEESHFFKCDELASRTYKD